MAQKTAVDWLAEQLKRQGFLYDLDIEAAKQMEKEQIINGYSFGYINGYDDAKLCDEKFEDSEQYYNETYNK